MVEKIIYERKPRGGFEKLFNNNINKTTSYRASLDINKSNDEIIREYRKIDLDKKQDNVNQIRKEKKLDELKEIRKEKELNELKEVNKVKVEEKQVENCSKKKAMLISITGKTLVFYINKDVFVIGKRIGQVDAIIDNKTVSRIHCQILCIEGEYFIEDLNSKNGTFVDGKRIGSNRKVKIGLGSVIKISNCSFIFKEKNL